MSDSTMSPTSLPRVPAIEGWFTVSDEPRLIGTKCTKSGTYFFPPEHTMSRAPGFADSDLESVELSTTGTLWSFTNAGYQPPDPFIPVTDPYEPFCIAAVHLTEEQIVILGQCPAAITVDDLEVGMEMELMLDTLYTDDDAEYVMWKWNPTGPAGSQEVRNG